MPTWWKFGFVASLLVMVGGLAVHVGIAKPEVEVTHDVVMWAGENDQTLSWGWGPEELPCDIFESCLYIEVHHTDSCDKQLRIEFRLTDADDNFVASKELVVESPQKSEPAPIEIGDNENDFEFFHVGEVFCTAAPLSDTADL